MIRVILACALLTGCAHPLSCDNASRVRAAAVLALQAVDRVCPPLLGVL